MSVFSYFSKAWTVTKYTGLFFLALLIPLSTAAVGKTGRVGGIYDITVAGITVGRGSVSLILQDNAYSAKIGMEPAGIGTLFSTGAGGAEATGWIQNNTILPSRYTMTSKAAGRDFYANLQMGSGHIREAVISPRFKPSKTRVKMTEAHKKNAMDPISAALLTLPEGAHSISDTACNRRLHIYDGWTRFDVELAYKETKQVQGNGYDGKVVVCQAQWIPVAGHKPERESVKLLVNAQKIEAWFAPVGNSGILIPYRIAMPTITGDLVIKAQELILSYGSEGTSALH
ncbi:DUF3108 domain-containing protein [Polycladidibacter stylochi]|uniref:DUF3108 domain-containing protein n=1 Tax=Polycladidibacter stylochi TaxID=1807766 RepID=UPI000A5C1446|nr:DUF3108 domain-containing protein [Pseudovibrio stylochi]